MREPRHGQVELSRVEVPRRIKIVFRTGAEQSAGEFLDRNDESVNMGRHHCCQLVFNERTVFSSLPGRRGNTDDSIPPRSSAQPVKEAHATSEPVQQVRGETQHVTINGFRQTERQTRDIIAGNVQFALPYCLTVR